MSGALPDRRVAQALSRVCRLAGDVLATVVVAVVAVVVAAAVAGAGGFAPAAIAAPLSPTIKPRQIEPGPPPPPFEQKSGALNFTRTVTATETGFRIERTFVSTTLMVPVENYRMLLDWLAAARRADDKPLVFVRKQK